MNSDDREEVNEAIRAAMRKARGYADFFGWATNRDLEEQGVVVSLAESLEEAGGLFFSSIAIRGRGEDPPDLEARDQAGQRIAFEVTELVDGKAIEAFKSGDRYDYADWSQQKFLSALGSLLSAKDSRFPKLKGTPYPGGYVVVVFTDEPALPRTTVESWLQGRSFPGLPHISRAFLLLSYDPTIEKCPFFELKTDG
jgi:hypothetical protein